MHMTAYLLFGMPTMPELGILLVIVFVVFGPGKLPEVMKSLGDGVNQFKKAANGHSSEPPRVSSPPEPERIESKPFATADKID